MRTSISQTFNLGLAKVTVSKSGLSVSTGIPGLRFSLNSKGQAGVRVGANGLSYAKTKKIL
jgi:hypothetical protein